MSNTYSAHIALEVLKFLQDAGCELPHVTLFPDGSGRFIIKRRDEEIALRVLNTCLVDERGPRPSGSGWNINGPTGYDLGFSFTRESLLYYREPSKHEKRQMLKGKS
jgi:hypothetical protein